MTKIIEFIEHLLDWFSTFFGRLKGLGFILALVAFFIFFVNNGCQKRHAEQLIEKLTGLDIQNDLLMKDNKQLDSLLIQERKDRQAIEFAYASKDKEATGLRIENQRLRTKLAGISQDLLNISADSSYVFLNTVAYPYSGNQIYPFNDPQVKGIHKDFLENSLLTSLVDTLTAQLDNCEVRIDLKDSIKLSYEKSLAITAEKDTNYNKALSNHQQIESILEKENRKLKRQKFFLKVTTGVAILTGILIAL